MSAVGYALEGGSSLLTGSRTAQPATMWLRRRSGGREGVDAFLAKRAPDFPSTRG